MKVIIAICNLFISETYFSIKDNDQTMYDIKKSIKKKMGYLFI
jgi:hypothetical protein